jgi:hypothetical protein
MGEAWMTDELPQSLEKLVLQSLTGAIKSREGWEAQRKDDEPPMSDLQVLLENIVAEVRRHGVILAELAVVPETRAELKAKMPDAVDRIPAWMEMRVFGTPLMTPALFGRGIAQLMGEHREAIERVVAEQVLEPEPIEEMLAEAPVPAGEEEEEEGEVIAGVGQALIAHVKALAEIAHDLDMRMAMLGAG